ncbi:MAG: hypothetical protein QOI82_2139 [Actinomycetota bacterium]|jgi:hypothetical protein|nr:hypothetical protein [Actinomycetota bacterium]
MTFPAASFTAVAPPPDGLSLAFTSARRRRNSKAAVSAFGGAVAIASVLSFLAPPGQTLVQEPAVPAHGGLLTGLPDAPRHGAPAPVFRTPANPSVVRPRATATHPLQTAHAVRLRPMSQAQQGACVSAHMLACLVVRTPVDDGPTMSAMVCPGAATVIVGYDAPQFGPTRASTHRRVAVGDCSS